ncbi:hypothetical protein VPHD482_0170 [Vibrio phage D482]
MNDNTRLIEVTATGHYSNATETQTCFVTAEFIEKYKDAIDTFTYRFHELDGKHSETEADIHVLESTKEMALSWADSRGEHWAITEVMFDHIRGYADEVDEEDFAAMISLNEDMNNTIEVRTRTEITIGTETITV